MTTANVEPWIPGDETFGARLALVRQRMGWGNVAEAAGACGIPVPSWRNWERDGRLPRNIVEIASVISQRSGCDYLWLLSGRGGRVLPTNHAVRELTLATAHNGHDQGEELTLEYPKVRAAQPRTKAPTPSRPNGQRRPRNDGPRAGLHHIRPARVSSTKRRGTV